MLGPVRSGRGTVFEFEGLEEIVKVWRILVHHSSKGEIGIVPRISFIALTRVAEPWTLWSLIGAAAIVLVAVSVFYAMRRR
jgi:hypothetical protein